MGGLVVKQMLHQASTENRDNIVNNTIDVVFYSCPHFGSKLADLPWRMGFVLRPTPMLIGLTVITAKKKNAQVKGSLTRSKTKLVDVGGKGTGRMGKKGREKAVYDSDSNDKGVRKSLFPGFHPGEKSQDAREKSSCAYTIR